MGCLQSVPANSAGKHTFATDFTVEKELGKGAFSTVMQCVERRSGKHYAAKYVYKDKLSKDDEAALKTEVDILRKMNHPNIIRMVSYYDEANAYIIVTELMRGGELFDRLVKKASYTEKEARDVVFILLSAIKYMHDCGIAHRDLKPENILLVAKNDDESVKLADFGFAVPCEGDSLTLQCGTPGYVAPEIIKAQKYGLACDMWSAGVIIFVLLGGYAPFDGANQKELFKAIKSGKYEFHEDYWSHVSRDAKDLINRMLTVDPHRRITATQALQHPWMTTLASELQGRDLHSSLVELRKYNVRRKFRIIIKAFIAAARMQKAIASIRSAAAESAGAGKSGQVQPAARV